MAASYRIAEAAELLGVSDDTVRRWIDSGRLPAHREGGGPAQVDGVDLARIATALHEPPEPGTTRGSSARNRLTGIVTGVLRDTVMAQVEIQAGPFRRVIELNADPVAEEARATYDDGILRVELPLRMSAATSRSVPIETGE